MKTRTFIFIALATIFAACNNNSPAKKYVGTWEPVEKTVCESVVITNDSIIGTKSDGTHCLQCHYKALDNNKIELERCYLEKTDREDYFATESIYFDENNYLVIENFVPTIAQQYPALYENLVLKKK